MAQYDDDGEEEEEVWSPVRMDAPISALEYLQSVYRNPSEPEGRRLRAAMAALQFESPRLGVIATTNMSDRDFARLLDRAIERANGVREVKALPSPGEPSSQ
jgi:hypothetical protein